MTTDSDNAAGRWKWGNILLRFTLAGLPELELFDSDEQRATALHEIGKESGRPTTWGYWLAVVTLVAAVVAVIFYARRLLFWIGVPPRLILPLYIAALVLTFAIVLRFLHRWGAQKQLRHKLLALNIPVCIDCGYLLRGLPPERTDCPECGWKIDALVRMMITTPERKIESA